MGANPKALQLGKATVAPGRTLHIPAGEKGAISVVHPGQEVELPVSEISTLRKRGFLVDPRAKAIPVAEGPTFGGEGAQVKLA